MKVCFDAGGSLVVKGEDATEWLALRTWCETFLARKAPLVVRTMEPDPNERECNLPLPRPSVRQLFRADLGSADELRHLIADDAFAATFQGLGQYRSALLRLGPNAGAKAPT